MLYTAPRHETAQLRGTVVDVRPEAGSRLAPSPRLWNDYRLLHIDWQTFARRYCTELRGLWRRDREALLDVARQAAAGDVTLAGSLEGNEEHIQCPRRVLADVVRQVAVRELGVVLEADPDAQYVSMVRADFDERRRERQSREAYANTVANTRGAVLAGGAVSR